MEFQFSPEQQMLRDTAWAWARSARDAEVPRSGLADGRIDMDGLWSQVAENDWLAITIPETAGGMGGSMVDACLVLEALAQELIPVPFAANAIIAPTILADADDSFDGLLESMAVGRVRVAPVVSQSLLRWPPAPGPALAWDWLPGDSLLAMMEGQPHIVDDVAVAQTLSVDPIRPLGELILPDSFVSGPETDAMRRSLAVARVAASVALVGTMSGALEIAIEHVTGRQQFGQPIGAFQSVQHMCADMLVELESSRAIAYGAAWTVENGDVSEAVSSAAKAKAWCGPAARRVCETAVQVLGGMGITWESDAHLYLRAAHLWGAAFGDEDETLSVVAEPLFATTTSDN